MDEQKNCVACIKVATEDLHGLHEYLAIVGEEQLPRSNLHYYFTTKSELYSAVLFDLLEVWKQDALSFETFDDPRVVLSSYIRAKMQRSRTRPYGSKVWANEIIHGAPTLCESLDASLYDWAKMKEAKIRQWVEDKRILPVEPSSLLYMIPRPDLDGLARSNHPPLLVMTRLLKEQEKKLCSAAFVVRNVQHDREFETTTVDVPYHVH